ncbi:MAG: hypothetical protein GY826_22245, partial [Fuerstiella sp.]|nr:hypothetical protein [Fuerstiella sp.]
DAATIKSAMGNQLSRLNGADMMMLIDEDYQIQLNTLDPKLNGTQSPFTDLLDLADLLEQTAGQGINVYTHGEMLPAHSYPELKKHPHLVGHYGGPWQNQQWEFPLFSGPIVGTTNCVLIPPDSYAGRLFTTRITAVPGGTRIPDNDFSPVIEMAKQLPALADNKVKESTIGFHHSVILGLAGQ